MSYTLWGRYYLLPTILILEEWKGLKGISYLTIKIGFWKWEKQIISYKL